MSQPVTLRTEAGDEFLDLAEFESRARRGVISPQCLVRFPAVTGARFVPALELDVFRGLQDSKRGYFARTFWLARMPWVTAGLIAINVAAYAVTAQSGPLDLDAMVRFGGKVGPLITDLGQLWRLLTANFLHKDALHIGLNMFVLVNVGAVLENAYRRLDFLLLLVVSGISTMTASLWLSDAVSVGASGMVYGCLGGVVVFGLKYRSILPARYRRMLGEAAIPTVLVFLWIGWTSAGVDNAAHLGGLVAGLVVAPLFRPRLLVDQPSASGNLLRALPSAGIVLGLFLAEAILGPRLTAYDIERDDAYGISIPVPHGWR
ncbi:MAG TPA: rhomboid family intramembrane serine protease, partial [Myxococcaceae bacterium]|nr:rhomboid family intramembrane serine protease [Myxococcaceae bacterium]